MIKTLINIPRLHKQWLIGLTDSVVLVLALLLSFSLRLGYWYWPDGGLLWVILGAPVIAVPIFIKFGLYHSIVRFLGLKALWSVVQAVSLYALIWGVAGFMVAIEGIPRSVVLINLILSVAAIGGLRMLARWALSDVHTGDQSNRIRVAIYGAGSSGRQLAEALLQSNEYKPAAFIDDNKDLLRQSVNGLKIYGGQNIKALIEERQIQEVLLALDAPSKQKHNQIISNLEAYPLHVRILPKVSELARGRVRVEDLREVSIDDVLGRDKVDPNSSLLHVNIENKVVMVTGAGGSIGSELCRQILKLGVRKLILFEQSELALYLIDRELNDKKKVYPVLGSVTNQARIEKICQEFGVQTIYHAAAYKHVPMVEYNTTEGVMNNVFGTQYCAQAAINSGVKTFVLISTDKAVRPTNTMGATKRSAEMVLQALAVQQNNTKFSMVRFGNVLDSSGSVIPLFKRQIKSGGPVTVTDINIVRYFMTIPEAVELVIQAGAMGAGGDVFVLDMGKPVRIDDLAKKMIQLSGLEVKSKSNPDGDIGIKYTGLRPGEKLFEELLIGSNVSKTEHVLIMRAKEEMLAWEYLRPALDKLHEAVESGDHVLLRALLMQIVPGFQPQCDIVDILYNKIT